MQLVRLKANCFRNLAELDLEFSSCFNFIYGPNGSGKSSLLEAIYFLSLGRSFRSNLASRAIQYQAKSFNLFSVILGQYSTTVGLEKIRQGKTKIKIGNNINSVSELAKLLPLQLINPNSYQLLSGGPRARRQFIDWGVFHVEPQFFQVWQRFQQILKQRNAGLQQQIPTNQIKIWDTELIEAASELTLMRDKYIQQLTPLITELLNKLLTLQGLNIDFYQGWDKKFSLCSILASSIDRDYKLAYTQFGPHRADLLMKLNGNPVHEVLSRGEQKLLTCALQLAQGILLKNITTKSCIYLFDDLFAELDSSKQNILMHLLQSLKSQVFITAIEETLIKELETSVLRKIFQVKQGKIMEKYLI
ncbi:MAG TPA: DNA replication/repair protein RecF [Candidatus Aquirickettsiella sp.]|jgi:DNA replication and repair protein RecF